VVIAESVAGATTYQGDYEEMTEEDYFNDDDSDVASDPDPCFNCGRDSVMEGLCAMCCELYPNLIGAGLLP